MECYAARHGKIKTEPQKHFINDSDKRKRKAVINDCKTCNTAKSVEPRSFAIHDTSRTLCFLALFGFFPPFFLWNRNKENVQRIFMRLFPYKNMLSSSLKWAQTLEVLCKSFHCWRTDPHLIAFHSLYSSLAVTLLKVLHWDTVMMLFFVVLEPDRCGQCKL